MIPANELRIGNYVRRIDTSEIVIVKGTVAFGINPYTNYEYKDERGELYIKSGLDDDNISPIYLNEERLLKWGFVKLKAFPSTLLIKLETYSVSPLMKLYVYLGDDGNVYSARIIQGNNKNGNMMPLLYLHQLQNLYFVLTGKELEVNI